MKVLSANSFLDSSEDLVLVCVGVGGEVVVLHVLVADGGQEPAVAPPPAPTAAPGLGVELETKTPGAGGPSWQRQRGRSAGPGLDKNRKGR